MKVYQRLLARAMSVLLLAGSLMVVSPARADAGLILYLCTDASCLGGDDFVIEDNDSNDEAPSLGAIVITVAGITFDTAITYPYIGSEAEPYLNMTYNIGEAGFDYAPAPYLYAAQSGFTAPGTAYMNANSSNSAGTAFFYTGAGSFLPSTAGAAAITCAFTSAPDGGCDGYAAVGGDGVPYYMALGVAPTPGIAGAASGDLTATVPDGGSTAALLGSVLVGVGMLRRRFSTL